MPSRRSPRRPAAIRVKEPAPTPDNHDAKGVEDAEDTQQGENNADDPCACPYCGKLGQQCDDHLLINIDVTFGEVWGPASDRFHEFVHRDDDGEILSRTLAFVSACEVVAVCRDHYAEGGPGMSSHDYWCWSRDPAKALEELKAELAEPE
jgi:hypothetical protein